MSRMIDDEETLKDNGLIEIDGCNVAECSLYCNGNCLKYMTEKNSIENVKCNSYCDYGALARQEQLQRAKAEKQDLINYYELREGGMLDDIKHWKNKAQELYKELEQYKKSKQASYESMQTKWIFAADTLRNVDVENEKLKAMAGVYSVKLMEKYKQALEEIKELLRGHQIADEARIEIILGLINKALND